MNVKGVAAIRNGLELVAARKLTQTHSAIEWLLQSDYVVVVEDRKRVDEGLVEAGVVQTEEVLKLPLEGVGARGIFCESIGL